MNAEKLIQTTIRVIGSFKEDPGHHLVTARKAAEEKFFHGVPLVPNRKIVKINQKQFLQSLVDNLKQRLSTTDDPGKNEVMDDLSVLDREKLTGHQSLRYGEAAVRRLCQKFSLDASKSVSGMRELIDLSTECDATEILKIPTPADLLPLEICMKTLPCSTAECERMFSVMNIVCSEFRSAKQTADNKHCQPDFY